MENDGVFLEVDPGAPFVHTREPEAVETPRTDNSELETIKAENARLAQDAKNARAEADRWAGLARRPEPRQEQVHQEPRREREAAATPPEKVESFLDDLSKEGLASLHKRGLITAEQLQEALADAVGEVREEMAEVAEAQAFDQRLATDFPELWEDNKKLVAWKQGGERGPAPAVSDYFTRTAEIYREQVADTGIDPESKAARALMVSSAKLAKRELAAEKKATRSQERDDVEPEPSPEARRRERIDGQAPRSRAANDDFDGRGTKQLNGTQRQVIGHLKGFGVSEETFTKFAGAGKGEHKHERAARS